MERLLSGPVVVIPFPFTDSFNAKVRPALVSAALTQGDVILRQITSPAAEHSEAASVRHGDFEAGGALPHDSFALPHRLVTANESCVERVAGQLRAEKLHQIRERVCAAIRET